MILDAAELASRALNAGAVSSVRASCPPGDLTVTLSSQAYHYKCDGNVVVTFRYAVGHSALGEWASGVVGVAITDKKVFVTPDTSDSGAYCFDIVTSRIEEHYDSAHHSSTTGSSFPRTNST